MIVFNNPIIFRCRTCLWRTNAISLKYAYIYVMLILIDRLYFVFHIIYDCIWFYFSITYMSIDQKFNCYFIGIYSVCFLFIILKNEIYLSACHAQFLFKYFSNQIRWSFTVQLMLLKDWVMRIPVQYDRSSSYRLNYLFKVRYNKHVY